MLIWKDEKSSLKIGKKLYKAGEAIPAGSLEKSRERFFIDSGQLENDKKVVTVESKNDKELKKQIKELEKENNELKDVVEKSGDKIAELQLEIDELLNAEEDTENVSTEK